MDLTWLKQYPFARLSLALIIGILTEWNLHLSFSVLIFSLLPLIAVYTFWLLLPKGWQHRWRFISGGCIFKLVIVTGCLLAYKADLRNHPQWIGKLKYQSVCVSLTESLKLKTNSYKSIAVVNSVYINGEWKNAEGKLLLYFPKDSSLVKKIGFGSVLITNQHIQLISNSGNPAAFNYQRYSLFQGITHQLYLKPNSFITLKQKRYSYLDKWIADLSASAIGSIKKYITGPAEQSVAEALLIGYRDDLDRELVQSYSNTGVVHIIAISGLHLGMIYGMLVALFSIIPFLNKKKWLKVIFILAFIWLFTLMAGAVPSVLRSAVMFSFIAVGQASSRRVNNYNLLAASAFCILLINPFYLWDVGFQLSYAAVLSIMIFQRKVYNLLYFQNKILDHLWSLNSVTISAQFFTLPFILYHFHQFPNLFLVANFIAVPLSGIILYGELLLLAISFSSFLAGYTGALLTIAVHALNQFILYLDVFKYAVTDNLFVSFSAAMFLCLSIFFLPALFNSKKQSSLPILFLILIFFSVQSFDVIRKSKQQQLIVYNVPKHSAADIMQGGQFYFIGDDELIADGFLRNFHLKPGRISLRCTRENLSLQKQHALTAAGKTILIMDKNSAKNRSFKADFIILSKNSNMKLTAVSASFNPWIIADGSNSRWKISEWKKECEHLHLRFHSVTEQGAFIAGL